MNQKGLIITCIILVILITGAYILYNNLSSDKTPDNLITYEEKEGEIEEESKEDFKAPDFTLYDRDGNKVKLSDFEGKPVVMNFWASWCPPCKNEMPDFNEKYLEYGDDIHFLMVNLTDGQQETKESAEKFLNSTNYSFPIYFDSDLEGAYTYGIYSVPQTFFIDSEGYLVTMAQGAISGDILQKGIDYIYEKAE